MKWFLCGMGKQSWVEPSDWNFYGIGNQSWVDPSAALEIRVELNSPQHWKTEMKRFLCGVGKRSRVEPSDWFFYRTGNQSWVDPSVVSETRIGLTSLQTRKTETKWFLCDVGKQSWVEPPAVQWIGMILLQWMKGFFRNTREANPSGQTAWD